MEVTSYLVGIECEGYFKYFFTNLNFNLQIFISYIQANKVKLPSIGFDLICYKSLKFSKKRRKKGEKRDFRATKTEERHIQIFIVIKRPKN